MQIGFEIQTKLFVGESEAFAGDSRRQPVGVTPQCHVSGIEQ